MRLGAIAGAKTGTYSASRPGTDTTDGHGRRVAGAAASFTFDASIQPASGRQIKALPEARHTEEIRVVYTVTELRGGPRGDIVTIAGEPWEVIRVETWDAYGSVHYRAYIARQVVP